MCVKYAKKSRFFRFFSVGYEFSWGGFGEEHLAKMRTMVEQEKKTKMTIKLFLG